MAKYGIILPNPLIASIRRDDNITLEAYPAFAIFRLERTA